MGGRSPLRVIFTQSFRISGELKGNNGCYKIKGGRCGDLGGLLRVCWASSSWSWGALQKGGREALRRLGWKRTQPQTGVNGHGMRPRTVWSLHLGPVSLSPRACQPVMGVTRDPTSDLPGSFLTFQARFFAGWICCFWITGRRMTLGTGNTILLKIWSCTNSSLEHKTKGIHT